MSEVVPILTHKDGVKQVLAEISADNPDAILVVQKKNGLFSIVIVHSEFEGITELLGFLERVNFEILINTIN